MPLVRILLLLLLQLGVVVRSLLVVEQRPNHDERNRLLLHRLEQLHLDNNADETNSAAYVLTLRNASGHDYDCTSIAAAAAAAAGVEPEARIPIAAPPPPVFSPEALEARMPLLQGACVSYNAGWWTTRWCHQTEAKQVHVENGKEATSYSLGKPVGGASSSSMVRFAKEQALFVVEHFADGQVCDETGKGRQLEARLYCCGEGMLSGQDTAGAATVPVFLSLQETTVCSYTLSLCWQPLCEAGLAALSPTNKDAWAALRPLTGLCFQRGEDSYHRNSKSSAVVAGSEWVHEVCFERSARVFRQVKEKKINTAAATRILQVDEKKMGTFQDTELGTSSSSFSSSSNGKEVVQLYTNGDACGGEGGERFSSRVRIACFLSKSTPAEIVSFRVTAKCETEVLLHAPGLCNTNTVSTSTKSSSSSSTDGVKCRKTKPSPSSE